jgi:hypothetical protein
MPHAGLQFPGSNDFTVLPSQFATAEQLLAVHTREHLALVASQDKRTDEQAAAEGGRM